MSDIDIKCMCVCGCETMVTVSKCQSRGKIWCGPCWLNHSTDEERAPHPIFKHLPDGFIRRVEGPGLIDAPIVSVPPMPKDWLPERLREEIRLLRAEEARCNGRVD